MSDPFRDFWDAWPGLRTGLNAAIEARDYGDLPREISELVHAMHERLEWELGPGKSAQHAFTLSAAGDMALRELTERWLRHAPPADEVWEFHPARQPRRGWGLRLADRDFDPADTRVGLEVDEGVERVHVRFFHPSFEGLDENARSTATFLTLDGCLGEDGVERWVGHIEPVMQAPGEDTLETLVERVEALAEVATGQRWAVLERDEGRVVAVINRALKRIDHPMKSMCCKIHVPLDSSGFANEAEDALWNALGERIAHLGRITTPEERTLLLFAAESSGVASEVETWCVRHGARAEWQADPRWDEARPFR